MWSGGWGKNLNVYAPMKMQVKNAWEKPLYMPYPTTDAPNKAREANLRRLQATDRLSFLSLASSLLFCVDFERAMEPNMHFYDS